MFDSSVPQRQCNFLSIVSITLWIEVVLCWRCDQTFYKTIRLTWSQSEDIISCFKGGILWINRTWNSEWTNQCTNTISNQSYISNNSFGTTVGSTENHTLCNESLELWRFFSCKWECINVQNCGTFCIIGWKYVISIIWVSVKYIRWIIIWTKFVNRVSNSEYNTWSNQDIGGFFSESSRHQSSNTFTNFKDSINHCYFNKFWETEPVDINIIKETINLCEWFHALGSELNVTRSHEVNNFTTHNSITEWWSINLFSYTSLSTLSSLVEIDSNCTSSSCWGCSCFCTNSEASRYTTIWWVSSSQLSELLASSLSITTRGTTTCGRTKTKGNINTSGFPCLPDNRRKTRSRSICVCCDLSSHSLSNT